jgi:hypothetical protein
MPTSMFPSLPDIYNKLSVALHEAREDSDLSSPRSLKSKNISMEKDWCKQNPKLSNSA